MRFMAHAKAELAGSARSSTTEHGKAVSEHEKSVDRADAEAVDAHDAPAACLRLVKCLWLL